MGQVSACNSSCLFSPEGPSSLADREDAVLCAPHQLLSYFLSELLSVLQRSRKQLMRLRLSLTNLSAEVQVSQVRLQPYLCILLSEARAETPVCPRPHLRKYSWPGRLDLASDISGLHGQDLDQIMDCIG